MNSLSQKYLKDRVGGFWFFWFWFWFWLYTRGFFMLKLGIRRCFFLVCSFFVFGYSFFECYGIQSDTSQEFKFRSRPLVEKYFPPLIKSCLKFQEEVCNQFFEGWIKEDLLVLFDSIFETGKNQDQTSKKDFLSDFEGAMSTIFGLIELRRRYPRSQGYVVISDLVLDRLLLYMYQSPYLQPIQDAMRTTRSKKTRHDGLVYRWEYGKFVIYKVFESKSSGKYSPDQSLGVFQRWKQMGLYIGGFHIKPEDIYFNNNNGYKLIHISKLKMEDFRKYLFLSKIKQRKLKPKIKDLLGQIYQVPFSSAFTLVQRRSKESYPSFFAFLGEKLYELLLAKSQALKYKKTGGIVSVIQNYYHRFIQDLYFESLKINEFFGYEDKNLFGYFDKRQERLFTYGFILPFFSNVWAFDKFEDIMNFKFDRTPLYQGGCLDFFVDIDF